MSAEAREPEIAFIVAVAENGVIGRGIVLPWRIPSDMRHFRRVTMGKPVIMGRRTFASLAKPLAGRDNIVLTHKRDYAPIGAIAVESVDQALKVARDCAMARSAREIMVIGGAQIYDAMLPYAQKIYLTRIHAAPEGDVRFAETSLDGWMETSRQFHAREAGDDYDYTIVTLERSGNSDPA